jgi:hypothetical protein
LQVKGRCLHSLLFIASQLGEAICEGVGYSEFHQFTRGSACLYVAVRL